MAEDVYEYCVTFLDVKQQTLPKTPFQSSRMDVKVFRFTGSEAFSITRMINGKSGYATALLEPLLKIPVTTRNWKTILRIIQKYSPLNPNSVSGGESA